MRNRIQARQQAYQPPFSSEVQRLGQAHQLACLYDAYQMLAIEMAERLYAQVGLEIRQPFWNARMVEFALATAERSRLRGQRGQMAASARNARGCCRKCVARSSKAEFSVTFSRYGLTLGSAPDRGRLTRRPGLGKIAVRPVDAAGV